MPTQARTIKQEFERLHSNRARRFAEAVEASRLTLPYLCNEEDLVQHQDKDKYVPTSRQNLGAELVNAWAASVLAQTMPAQIPFSAYELFPIAKKQAQDAGQLTTVENYLRQRRDVVHRLINVGPVARKNNRRIQSIRTKALTHYLNYAVVGNACARIDSEGNTTNFAFVNWVCERDSYTDILQIIVREKYDVLELGKTEQANLPAEKMAQVKELDAYERMADVYTRAKWEPSLQCWFVESEVWDTIISTEKQKHCAYHVDADNLINGEDYGISRVMVNIKDLLAYDELWTRLMDHAAIASEAKLAIDRNSDIDPERVKQTPARGITNEFDVSGGQVQNAAVFAPANVAGFEVSFKALQALEQKIRSQFNDLAARDSERTTALEVARVTLRKAETAFGPMLAAMGEGWQTFLVERFEMVAEKMGLIEKMSTEARSAFRVAILTGAAALAKQSRAVNVAQFVDIVSKLPVGENFPPELNRAAVIDDIRDSMALDPDIVYTPQQIEDNARRAAQARVQEEAANQLAAAGAQTAGGILETALTQQTR
jgi:hypothetical protein